LAGILIVIVEARSIDRTFLARVLTSAGHSVIEASDVLEGLRLAERMPPDLVVSGILMPTADGCEFVRRMHQVGALVATPVIFHAAAYHERDARALAQQCGVADVLIKRSEPKAILAKIDAVLAAGGRPPAPGHAPSRINRDPLPMVRSALESPIEDFQASEQRMAAIAALAHQIAAEREAHVLLEGLCAAAREVTLAQHAIITMTTGDRSAFQRVATAGLDDETLGRMEMEAVDGPAFHRAIAERRPVRLRNPDGRPEAIGLPKTHPLTYSLLVVPVASPGAVYGCLALHNRLGAEGFSDRDEELVLTLAAHAGIAYENAQLHDDLRHRIAGLEQELGVRRRAEARTQLALTAARMGVWELDLATDRLDWSDSLAAIFGLSGAHVPTTNSEFTAVIHPDDRAGTREGLERAIRERTDLVNEFRTIWPDGTVHWIAGRARVLSDERGNPARIIGVGMDIGERKSLEEQLRRAHKMEAVGQLAAGVTHDFNNLLTVIHGYAELLVTTLSADDGRRTDVDAILKGAERAADLTRQLLAFSRKPVRQPTLLDLNSLVANTSRLLRRLIGEDIDLVTTLTQAPAAVHADAGQLEQILLNLAVNARDAMPNGGRLAIETAAVVLDDSYAMQGVAVRPGPYVMLAVTDSGIGMDEKTTTRIFEPFFTTKERGRGTGLGLATVYGIVKETGGYIGVSSGAGRGSTFTVYLPQAEEAAIAKPAATEAVAAPTGSETVLLVEDEQAVRVLCRVLLERAGYQVLDAADPRHAEDLFRHHPDRIDLLVTDVIMPGSSGPSLFARLSVERPHLKVLYMSGYADHAMVQPGTRSSDAVFLQKPFTADGLLRKVREALDR
jgi:PAS domain S-box-containing protein